MAFLKISGIGKAFDQHIAVRDVSFTQRRYQKVAIAGETGSGKSTLLKVIAGLVQPDTGEVTFEGRHIKGPDETLVAGHLSIAYLSQNFELAKFLRVEQVLAYANVLSDDAASALFQVCQISHLLQRRTDQLSGGERQRIAICRLLISSPRLLLLDEPFTHLDIPHKDTLQRVILDIGEKLKITVMLVSHDPTDILSWADKIVVIRAGSVVQKGTPSRLYENPADAYVAGLFGRYNVLSDEQATCMGLAKSTKSIMLRPEQIQVRFTGAERRKGRVTAITFFGDYSLIDVAFRDGALTVRTGNNHIQQNDKVFVYAMRPRK